MTDMGTGASPRLSRRVRPWHIILAVIGGFALLGLLLFLILSRVLGPLVESGNQFMGALGAGDFPRAHALATPALQQQIGDAQSWGATIGRYQPAEWSWSQRSVRNGIGLLEGSVTYRGGHAGRARLQFHQVDGQWRVASYSLN